MTRDRESAVRVIVMATDFSENADVALAWAEQVARQHEATLVLVHAVASEPFAAPESVSWRQRHAADIRARAKSRLHCQAEAVRRRGLAVDCVLGLGSAADVVIETADGRGADIVVAGTRGRTGLKRLLLGSTAAHLIRNARCPVLIVHPSDAGTPRPARRVLVPTDFSEDAVLAANAAARILGVEGADGQLTLLHSYHVEPEATYLPASILMDAIAAADATVKRIIEERAAALRQSGIRVDTVVWEGEPPSTIVHHAKSLAVDLIAMATHGLSGVDRLFLGSTAEQVVASAPCPVLTVRREVAKSVS
jgi:nucleotide-binding universal stress UspA family protein